jgi:hypothetical protein
MPQQPDLLAPKGLDLTPAEGLTEPRLWVRRLVIWKEPGGEVVRDVPLRPGLNIIWSPDRADNASTTGQQRSIGHGGGKTLFCRLLRYCLGENRFATDAQRERIGPAFPNGIVGAEVMLDGACWAIVRPLGSRRRHMAVPHGQLDEIAAGEGASTGLLDAKGGSLKSVDDIALHAVIGWEEGTSGYSARRLRMKLSVSLISHGLLHGRPASHPEP